ncbi:hypothetical protein ACA910_007861 [Epithemia clementina (nom. ined.)]
MTRTSPRPLATIVLISFLIVLLSGQPQSVQAAVCNICGCDGCEPGNLLAIVRYPNPTNTTQMLKQNCQTLETYANREDNAFTREQCEDLYKRTTQACACYYPNGTDVPAYGSSEGDDDDDHDNTDSSSGGGSGGSNGGGGDSGGGDTTKADAASKGSSATSFTVAATVVSAAVLTALSSWMVLA